MKKQLQITRTPEEILAMEALLNLKYLHKESGPEPMESGPSDANQCNQPCNSTDSMDSRDFSSGSEDSGHGSCIHDKMKDFMDCLIKQNQILESLTEEEVITLPENIQINLRMVHANMANVLEKIETAENNLSSRRETSEAVTNSAVNRPANTRQQNRRNRRQQPLRQARSNHDNTPRTDSTSSEESVSRGGMVKIGMKTEIPWETFKRVRFEKPYTWVTRDLLKACFSRETIGTHSLTGNKSPAFAEKEAKAQLNETIVGDIVMEVCKRFNVTERLVRSAITTACADECKMLRNLKKPKRN